MTNLNPGDFAYINASDFRILENKFNEYGNSDEVSFEDFKEIINSSSQINKEIINGFLERIKKKIRDSVIHSDNDHISIKRR